MCNIYRYIYIYIFSSKSAAINALYFVHRAPYGGEDSTLYVIYLYLYIYHIEGAVFTTIWCSMYKVQSVDSRNAEKEETDSLLL